MMFGQQSQFWLEATAPQKPERKLESSPSSKAGKKPVSLAQRVLRHSDATSIRRTLLGCLGELRDDTDKTSNNFLWMRLLDSPLRPPDFYRELFVTRYNRLRSDRGNNFPMDPPARTFPLDEAATEDHGPLVKDTEDLRVKQKAFDASIERMLQYRPKKKRLPEVDSDLIDVVTTDDDDVEDSFDFDSFPSKFAKNEVQKKFLTQVVFLLKEQRLAELAHQGHPDEPILVSNAVAQNISRLRQAYSYSYLDSNLIRWGHVTLLENLNHPFLAVYFKLLRALKPKCGNLVETIANLELDSRPLRAEIQALIFKKDHDPIATAISKHPVKKLRKNYQFILVNPTFTVLSEPRASKSLPRHEYFFKTLFPMLGKCSEVRFIIPTRKKTVAEGAQIMMDTLKDKIQDARKNFHDSPVVLVGWDTTCLVALKVALDVSVAAVVCLAFPNLTTSGVRGDVDDELVTLGTSALFVVGQFSSSCSIDDLQDTRDLIVGHTGLVVVGAADQELQVAPSKMAMESINQKVVDRMILDCVADFMEWQATAPQRSRQPDPLPIPSNPRKRATTSSINDLRQPKKRLTTNKKMEEFQRMEAGAGKPMQRPIVKDRVTPMPMSIARPGTVAAAVAAARARPVTSRALSQHPMGLTSEASRSPSTSTPSTRLTPTLNGRRPPQPVYQQRFSMDPRPAPPRPSNWPRHPRPAEARLGNVGGAPRLVLPSSNGVRPPFRARGQSGLNSPMVHSSRLHLLANSGQPLPNSPYDPDFGRT